MKDVDSYTRNFSPTMPSIYASDASKLIKKASRNFMLTSILLISIFGFGIFDILNEMHLISLSDTTLDLIIVSICTILIGVTFYFHCQNLKSKKIFDRWSDIFKRNSISTTMRLTLSRRTKEDALKAIGETLEEIGEGLTREAMRDPTRFIDAKMPNGIHFDVLVDKDRTLDPHLSRAIHDYGAIIIKITDNEIKFDEIMAFSKMISQYVSQTGNKVGLSLFISPEVDNKILDLVGRSSDKVMRNMILVEKASVNSSTR